MGLQVGLIVLGLAVFGLILLDALRRKHKAARQDKEEDPEYRAKQETLARELPGLKDWQDLDEDERKCLDPLFDEVEVFDDDPIPLLKDRLCEADLAHLRLQPSDADQADEDFLFADPELESSDTVTQLTSESMQRLFSRDPAFDEAARQMAAQEAQMELSLEVPEPPQPQMIAKPEPETDEADPRISPEPGIESNSADTSIPTPSSASSRLALELNRLQQMAWSEAEQFLSIHVEASKGRPFSGQDLHYLATETGMARSQSGFYHFVDKSGSAPCLAYSLVNMFSPGNFPESMSDFSTAGVVLVMVLPSTLQPMTTFERMLEVARVMERCLGAELQDEQRSNLTQQTVEHYRQRIQEFERHQHIKAKKIYLDQ